MCALAPVVGLTAGHFEKRLNLIEREAIQQRAVIEQMAAFAAEAIAGKLTIDKGEVASAGAADIWSKRLQRVGNRLQYELMRAIDHAQLGSQLIVQHDRIHQAAGAGDDRRATARPAQYRDLFGAAGSDIHFVGHTR
jgi:hypothetical protein